MAAYSASRALRPKVSEAGCREYNGVGQATAARRTPFWNVLATTMSRVISSEAAND